LERKRVKVFPFWTKELSVNLTSGIKLRLPSCPPNEEIQLEFDNCALVKDMVIFLPGCPFTINTFPFEGGILAEKLEPVRIISPKSKSPTVAVIESGTIKLTEADALVL